MSRLLLLITLLVSADGWAGWRYMSVDGAGGVPLSVVTVGQPERPALVFIHGISQSHFSFRKQLDSDLADEFYLVAFDLRGHGASGKPWAAEAYTRPDAWAGDIAAVIEATQAREPILVAWSYGTLVALDYIRVFGVAGIAGLNLTGAQGALLPWRQPDTADDAFAAEIGELQEMRLSPNLVDNVLAARRVAAFLTAAPLPEDDQQLFASISLMLPAYARRAMLAKRMDNTDLLPRLTLPTLLSAGDKDNPTLREDAVEMAATYDNINVSVYQDAGHTVFYEQPERFNAELRQFARGALASQVNPGKDR